MDALQKALKLLAARARTVRELEAALARAKFSPEERAAALARVRELGYMDDRELARARARTLLARGEAPRLARRRLEAQGIAPADAASAVTEQADGASEAELARNALQRKLRGRAPAGEKERRRLLRALVNKGHRAQAVAQALGMSWDGDDEPEADD